MLSTIGIVIDIIILSALVIAGIIGFKKGFFKSILAFFSWVVCAIVAIMLAKYVAKWINGIYNFSGLIGGKIASALNGQGDFFKKPINSFGYENKEQLIAAIPSGTNGMLAQLIKVVFNNAKINYATCTSSVSTIVGTSIGKIVVIVIAGILVFAVLKLAVFLLTKLLDKITSNAVFGTLNKIFGAMFGVLKMAVVIVVLNFVLVLLSLLPFVNKTIKPLVQDNTVVERVIYKGTDKLVEKYVINGDLIKGWISTAWDKR